VTHSSALEAHALATCAFLIIRVAASFLSLDIVKAAHFGAPSKILVTVHVYVLLEKNKFSINIFRSETLNVVNSEFFTTVEIHTFYFENLTICYLSFKVVTHAVFAVRVRTAG
jgi:hypothetical protein